MPGDLILWQHGDTVQGHVGIVIAALQNGYLTVEGNTSDSLGIDREGDGVFVKLRPKGGTSKMKQLGFLRAFL